MSAPLDTCTRCHRYGHTVLMCPEPAPPRVSPEGPREHTANALMSLSAYREARGSGWHQVLNRADIQVAELSALLESVEARLRLALDSK